MDLRDPASPKRIGVLESAESFGDIALSGSLACVLEQRPDRPCVTDLDLIDVREPTRPHKVGRYDTGRWATHVAVSAGYAFVAVDNHGLQVIDASQPANPKLSGRWETVGFPSALTKRRFDPPSSPAVIGPCSRQG
jgi:hypothetical protein